MCVSQKQTQSIHQLSAVVEKDVAVSNRTLSAVEGYQLRLVEIGNTTIIYSTSALLKLEQSDAKCAIIFLGANSTDIVAVTEPVQ